MARLLWTQRQDMGPSPRWGHAMVYDSARDRTVLFGGWTPATAGDTWEWNGELWTQVEDIGPSARGFHAMAYDAARAQVILFGGDSSADPHIPRISNGDTWAWDGDAWTQVANTGPSPRIACGMAYDNDRERVVLFGGNETQETWEWDGNDWTQAADGGPSARPRTSLTYDSVRGRVVLFGGSDNAGERQNDTWEFDGAAWTLAADTGPEARSNSALAFAGTRTILFGGESATFGGLKDTWEWSGKYWTQRQNIGPRERAGHAMAYDANRDRIVLFGGLLNPNGPNAILLNDTWEAPGNRVTLKGVFTVPDRLVSDGTGTIVLNSAAPIGGVTVTLSSQGPVSIPASVNIAEGKTLEVFPLKADNQGGAEATATITAKLGGSVVTHSTQVVAG